MDKDLKEALKERYRIFQDLLSKNNQILGIMADMEEKYIGEHTFDRHYINTNSMLVAEKVAGMVRDLNSIADGRYQILTLICDDISTKIEDVLYIRKSDVLVGGFVVPVEGLSSAMSNIAGGKMANLGEIKKQLNMLIPEGFVITAYAFRKFFEYNGLTDKISKTLAALDMENPEELDSVSREIQQSVIEAEVPVDIQDEIRDAYSTLCRRVGGEVAVSVRSSAILEDGEFSFAGQYSTFLNVHGASIIEAYKKVVASLFTQRAIFYYKTKGLSEEELIMAVGVLRMIDAMSAGVMYTIDPNDPDRRVVIINALWGIGKSVVDGTIDPDAYIIDKSTGAVLEKDVRNKCKMITCDARGDIKEIDTPSRLSYLQCLADEHILTLFQCAVALERHYGRPQDIEWAVDHNGLIYILQTRRLRAYKPREQTAAAPVRIEGHSILIDKGIIACKGVGHGRAFVLKNENELKDFPEGAVLVAKHTSTRYVTVMNKAAAIITDIGGVTGHMASLSREYRVPTILDTEAATSIIKNGQEITVDALHGCIYEGKVDALLEYALNCRGSFKGTHLYNKLEEVLKFITPLNLIDPDMEDFRPENCKTFHDIIRFAHEMAMVEIFNTGKGREISSLEDFMSAITFAESGETKEIELQAIKLNAGIPLDIRIIDIEDGVSGSRKKAKPDDITSIPFSAFLKGMTGINWPVPGPAGADGLAARSVSVSKDRPGIIQKQSYAAISRNYMNVCLRLEYHYSEVEAYAGENVNDNYIKFFFKGGGASADRISRRVMMIKKILNKLNFKVNVIEDLIDATLTKYKKSAIEEKLEIIGKLTAYTKQLDLVIHDDAVADMFIDAFIRDHVSLIRK